MAKKVWCVCDKHGIWCRTSNGKEPKEGVTSVETACGDWIVLPHGVERRQPTCVGCSYVATDLYGARG